MLETVKKGQGVVVRRVAFWGVALLILWGGQSLYTWLINSFEVLKQPVLGGDPRTSEVIPVLNQRFNFAFLVSWGVVLGGLAALHRVLNRPKVVDFLIDVDNELKKVTWPTWKEAWRSSVIVVIFVVVLTTFLLLSDFLLSRGIGLIL